MLTPDKIIEIFCIADDFCKEFEQEIKNIKLEKVPNVSGVISLPDFLIVRLLPSYYASILVLSATLNITICFTSVNI
jgi:hypothetical protein